MVQTSDTFIGNINPIRYRGYYYDRETGFYYLQSRYYDPEVGRFLNADGLVSTGQGLLGTNMFAYCYNNPIRLKDSTGTLPDEALEDNARKYSEGGYFVSIGGSGKDLRTTGTGAAPSYVSIPGGNNSPNCYSYSVGLKKATNPGTKSETSVEINNVKSVARGVEKDLVKMGRSARSISGPDGKIYDYEYRIALRVGQTPFGVYTDGTFAYDYHFMVQTSTGQWAEKHGTAGSSILWDVGMTPDTIPWTLGGAEYYDSEIIYMAITS